MTKEILYIPISEIEELKKEKPIGQYFSSNEELINYLNNAPTLKNHQTIETLIYKNRGENTKNNIDIYSVLAKYQGLQGLYPVGFTDGSFKGKEDTQQEIASILSNKKPININEEVVFD